jgi:hypothetical protein
MAYNPLLFGALPAAFSTSKLYAWSAYHQAYYSAASVNSVASYGAPPRYGSGVLYGTSLGLNRSMVSILRDAQAGLDPNSVALQPSWGIWHVQPCAPWGSANAYPGQRNTSTGYGRSWLGVTCTEWDLTINAVTAQYGGLSDLDVDGLGMVGTIPVQLCELFPSVTFIDLSENMLVGSLPTCFGQQATVVSGRFKLSVFDNLVRAPPGRLLPRCCRTHACCHTLARRFCLLVCSFLAEALSHLHARRAPSHLVRSCAVQCPPR